MQRRQTGRIALLISMILHLILVFALKNVIVYNRVYKEFDAVHADLINMPDSIIKPMPRIPERIFDPIRKTRMASMEAPKPSTSKLTKRPVVANKADETVFKADIPTVDTSVLLEPSLSSPFSREASAIGAPSQGRGRNEGSGSSRRTQGGLASVNRREISVIDDSVSEKFQVYDEAELPLARALQEIAQHVVNTRSSRKADIVFIIDTSASMQNDIDAVAKYLNRMLDKFQKADLDFTLGVVRFHHSMVYEWLGMDITISPQTSDVEEIRRILKSIKVSGGERALDALMKAISEVKFRPGADRHFILVTDEYVKGTYQVQDVLRAAKRSKITIDVMGRDEPFQRTIAKLTGGIWTSIKKIRRQD